MYCRTGSIEKLPIRLMVGRHPLEVNIGVRVPDRQQNNEREAKLREIIFC